MPGSGERLLVYGAYGYTARLVLPKLEALGIEVVVAGRNAEKTEESWVRAVEYFEAMDPPGLLDVAAMCNNLAYLRRAVGDYDQAETYFLKALEILEKRQPRPPSAGVTELEPR